MLQRTAQFGILTLFLAGTLGMGTLPGATPGCVDIKAPSEEDKKLFNADLVSMNPAKFFETLVDRYQSLSTYSDATQLVQITRRPGERELQQETSLICEVEDGELLVRTPTEQMREGFGLNLPFRQSEAMKQLQLRYKLWLAPHMTLKFSEQPLKEMREGIEEGFKPFETKRVMYDDRPMYHLTLQSCNELGDLCEAKYDFYINPVSMLIEHIDGYQHLPDGSDFITTLDIQPRIDESDYKPVISG